MTACEGMSVILLSALEDSTDLIDVAEDDLLDRVMLQNFAHDAAVTATDDKDLLWVWVTCQRNVGDHLLVPVHPGQYTS